MATNPWFKFYGGEYLADPKIASLTPQERSCWVTLLCLAGMSSEAGKVEFLTIDALLQKSGIVWDPYDTDEWDRATTVLDKLERMKMISKGEDGVIEIKNWAKRQETNLTDAERAKSYRDRKRHANVTDDVTNVTQEENREEENKILGANAQYGTSKEEEKPEKQDSRVKDKLAVYHLFSKTEQPWWNFAQEKKAALSLYDLKGLEQVRAGKTFMDEHSDDEFCPQASTPFEYAKKLPALLRYKKKLDV